MLAGFDDKIKKTDVSGGRGGGFRLCGGGRLLRDEEIYERLPVAFYGQRNCFVCMKAKKDTGLCEHSAPRDPTASAPRSPYGFHKVATLPCSR